MAVDKRCAASGRAQQAESAASEIQHVKTTFAENFAKSSKRMHERRFAAMSSLRYDLARTASSIEKYFAKAQHIPSDVVLLS